VLRERVAGEHRLLACPFRQPAEKLIERSLRGDSATRGSRRQAADDNRLAAACALQSSSLHPRAATTGPAAAGRVSHRPSLWFDFGNTGAAFHFHDLVA
jgi:hypothetical protein